MSFAIWWKRKWLRRI